MKSSSMRWRARLVIRRLTCCSDLAHLDGEEVVVHQAADGFAGEQVGGKGFEQGIGERMPMDDAAGLALFIEYRQRVQVGLAAEGFQHRGGRRIARAPLAGR